MDDWDVFRAGLAADLARLHEGDSVVLEANPAKDLVRARRVWWGRHERPASYVQFLANPPVLMGECSGPRSRGGSADLDEKQQAAIAALGWRDPSGVPTYRSALGHNYWRDWEDGPHRHVVAAALAVATLSGPLGVPSPREVVVGPR